MLAHGLGAEGLPIDAVILAWGTAALIIASFVGLGILWRDPNLAGLKGKAMGSSIARLADLAALAGKALAAAVYIVTISAALTGSSFGVLNIAPWVIFIAVGVAMPIASFLLGDIWRAVSPLRTLGSIAEQIGERLDLRHETELTDWPAALALAGFFWLDLAYHAPASPRLLGWLIIGYTIWAVVPAARWGVDWTDRADGLGWWFTVVASMAPWRRDHDTIRFRWPTVGVVGIDVRDGSVMAILIVIGSQAFDGVSRTSQWGDVVADRFGWNATFFNSLGLIWVIALVASLYLGASKWAGRTLDGSVNSANSFLPALVTVAFGYVVAHTFATLIFDGQTLLIRASDPFGRGSDWFGTAAWIENTRVVSGTAIAWVQIGAILVGQAVATMVAHDRAVLVAEDQETALRSQFAIVLSMALLTAVGLNLLVGE